MNKDLTFKCESCGENRPITLGDLLAMLEQDADLIREVSSAIGRINVAKRKPLTPGNMIRGDSEYYRKMVAKRKR